MNKLSFTLDVLSSLANSPGNRKPLPVPTGKVPGDNQKICHFEHGNSSSCLMKLLLPTQAGDLPRQSCLASAKSCTASGRPDSFYYFIVTRNKLGSQMMSNLVGWNKGSMIVPIMGLRIMYISALIHESSVMVLIWTTNAISARFEELVALKIFWKNFSFSRGLNPWSLDQQHDALTAQLSGTDGVLSSWTSTDSTFCSVAVVQQLVQCTQRWRCLYALNLVTQNWMLPDNEHIFA